MLTSQMNTKMKNKLNIPIKMNNTIWDKWEKVLSEQFINVLIQKQDKFKQLSNLKIRRIIYKKNYNIKKFRPCLEGLKTSAMYHYPWSLLTIKKINCFLN